MQKEDSIRRGKTSSQAVGKSAAFLYIETLVSLVAGYAFWVIISRIAPPDMVGTSSALVSFATIFATVSTLGVPSGVQRFIGKIRATEGSGSISLFVKAAILWSVLGAAACGLSMYVLNGIAGGFLGFEPRLIMIAILYVFSFSLSTLFRSIIISLLKTSMLPVVMIISTIVKIGLAAVLVSVGLGAVGISLGFTAFSVISSVLLVGFLLSAMRKVSATAPSHGLLRTSKELLVASAANWIPSVVYTIGAHLGPIFVFGSQGAAEAGIYFMAFAIAIAVSSMMQVLFTIAFPVLSGMKDGRKRMTWQTTKMTLILTMPLSAALMFFAGDIMSLFGAGYRQGGSILEVLLASMLPIALSTGVTTLAYAYGNYRQVLAIGIASNLPRAALYLILLPVFGSMGASFSYTAGSVAGLAVSIVVARKIGMKMKISDIAFVALIPSALGLALQSIHMNFLLGIPVLLAASYLLLAKIHVMSREDIGYMLGLLPRNVSERLSHLVGTVSRPRGNS